MDLLKKFDIDFAGLSIGKHHYDFDMDEKFFACFEHAVIEQGKLHAHITLHRQRHLLQFDCDIKGQIRTTCDRCTDEFEMPVDTLNTLLVKIGDHAEEEDVDVYMIPATQTHWNIAQQLYEYICMAKPLRTVHLNDAHGNSTCNAEFIKQLEKIVNTNDAKTAQDPRWDALKKIKEN